MASPNDLHWDRDSISTAKLVQARLGSHQARYEFILEGSAMHRGCRGKMWRFAGSGHTDVKKLVRDVVGRKRELLERPTL